ncbi:Transpos_assoc domain-containing protein [Cephalotus follicularis]|uniref:Transpos_assoc domain-containing protein n=1 Tax=Cephalotus follicularis TaxID=3775 RepID=A0A1Q3CYC7_CEPFO|nr:Transpos_assoc domain-containing protein [Cephalotus follicularis]
MDNSWIDLRRINPRAYDEAVRMFLNFAYKNKNQDEFIRCRCIKCANDYYHGKDTVSAHFILDGFLTTYKKWTRHGEGNIGNTVNVSHAVIVDHNTGDDVQVESSLAVAPRTARVNTHDPTRDIHFLQSIYII